MALFGDVNVGKTTLGKSIAGLPINDDEESTIGAAFRTATLKCPSPGGQDGDSFDKEPLKLHIWDTAGQERFQSLSPIYMNQANVMLLVYDVTSVYSIQKLYQMCRTFQQRLIANGKSQIIIGNKMDLLPSSSDPIDSPTLQSLMGLFDDVQHVRVSVKTGEGMEELRKVLYNQLHAAALRQQSEDPQGSVYLTNKEQTDSQSSACLC